MIIDTSVLLAILQQEPEAQDFIERLETAEMLSMSVGNFLETSIVIQSRFGADGVRDLDLFISKAGIELAACDPDQAHIARRAYREFGKGRHPAGLNFGDCFAYALSMARGEPLLFKGNDFSQTDVLRAD